MKRFEFTQKVTGYVVIGVEAENEEDAIKEADDEFSEMDFGELWNIDSEIVF